MKKARFAKKMQTGPFFIPVGLNVANRSCLVVGNDREAFDKAGRLAKGGARVTVIAPSFEPRFRKIGARLVRRQFRITDLKGRFYVVYCHKENKAQTRQVARFCRSRNILLCAIDQTTYCDVANVSIFERGDLRIAVSTNAIAPAVARKIREGLEEGLKRVPIEKFLRKLAKVRVSAGKIKDPELRREKLLKAAEGFKFSAKMRLP